MDLNIKTTPDPNTNATVLHPEQGHAAYLSKMYIPPPQPTVAPCIMIYKPRKAHRPDHAQPMCIVCGVQRKREKCRVCETGHFYSCCSLCCAKCRGECDHTCFDCTECVDGPCGTAEVGGTVCCKDELCACCENSSFDCSMHRIHIKTDSAVGIKLASSASPLEVQCCGEMTSKCWWDNEDSKQECRDWAALWSKWSQGTPLPRSMTLSNAKRFQRAQVVLADVSVEMDINPKGANEYIAISLKPYVDRIFKFSPEDSQRLVMLPALNATIKRLSGWKDVCDLDVVIATKGVDGGLVEQRHDFLLGSSYGKSLSEGKSEHVSVRHASWTSNDELSAVLVRTNVHKCIRDQLSVLNSISDFSLSSVPKNSDGKYAIIIGQSFAKECASPLAYLACKYCEYLCGNGKGQIKFTSNAAQVVMQVKEKVLEKWLSGLKDLKQMLSDLSDAELRLYPTCGIAQFKARAKGRLEPLSKFCDILFYGEVNHLV